MMPSRQVSVGVLGVSLFLVAVIQQAGSICAQSPDSTSPKLIPRTKAEREHKYQAHHLIALVAQVTDSSGKPVTGLKADDFSLLDNRTPTRTTSFHEFEGPASTANVHVMLVLDAINDGGSSIGHVKKDLDKFLAQHHEALPFPITLVFASGSGESESQPSTDRSAVANELAEFARRPREAECDQTHFIEGSRMSGQAMGSQSPGNSAEERADCMISHFTESVSALRSLIAEQNNVRGRTILIWTGRGWPLLADFGIQAEAQRGNYRDVLVELTTNLREAQVTLDAVSWGDFETPRNSSKPLMSVTASAPSTPDAIAEVTMALPALARQNGGQAVARVKNFADAMDAILADAGDFYELSFDSIPAAAADEFHSIDVKVDRPGVNVRAESSYYAQP
ncbi:MAG TPA: VWA domain-containing protein [Terracidiphilus sp.]|nr:VWA domain-containing protein [Terracidiphilus sp.]